MLFPKWSGIFVHYHSFTIILNVLYTVKAPVFHLIENNLFSSYVDFFPSALPHLYKQLITHKTFKKRQRK